MNELCAPQPRANRRRVNGRCYELAGRYVLGHEHGVLVHGAPYSEKFGRRIGHAWVEYRKPYRLTDGSHVLLDVVWDPSIDGPDQEVLKGLYYYIGKLDEDHVCRYPHTLAATWLATVKHWGPWEGPAVRACHREKGT